MDRNDDKRILKNYFEQAGINYEDSVIEHYLKFIEDQKWFKNHNKRNYYEYTAENFLSWYESLYNFLENQGYSEEQIIHGMKTLPIAYRQSVPQNLPVFDALGIKDDILIDQPQLIRNNINELHARKMYILDNDLTIAKSTFLKGGYIGFKKLTKTTLSKAEMLEKYPLTDDIRKVFNYLYTKTDKEIEGMFNLTRQEVLKCYPTTLDELKSIQRVGYYDDKAFKERYGITKQEMLEKYPLNRKTLSSVRFINLLPAEKVIELFGKTKEELLSEKRIDVSEERKKYEKESEDTVVYQKKRN